MAEHQKTVLENGLWKYNLARGKYYFSPEICKIFNLELQDLKSHDVFLKWIHPADKDHYQALYDEKMKTLQSFILSYRIVLRDNTVKNIEEHVNFLMDEEAHTMFCYGIVSDVSRFIQLQNESNKAYSLINSIMRTLPNLVFVKEIDAGYRFALVNDNFASFYGFTPDEIVGKYDKDISTPEQAKECYITDGIASKHDIASPLISLEKIPISPRVTKYMQTIKFAHVINGTNYLICSAMDITDLVKAKQKAEESDKLKSAFLSSISHEIRTPMNSIMGYAELLGNSRDKDDMDIFCEKVKDNSEQLLNVISDIVYLAKLESGNKNIVCEDTDIELLFTAVESKYEKQVRDKKLKLVYTPHSSHCSIYTNKDGITELLKCFVENAIKFTEKGSITIGYDWEDNGIKIWVKDTGIGFDKKKKKDVFKRFVKLNEFTIGTGIGLYISQKITKSMKGKIGIDSEVGKGSLVWAWLPLNLVKQV